MSWELEMAVENGDIDRSTVFFFFFCLCSEVEKKRSGDV